MVQKQKWRRRTTPSLPNITSVLHEERVFRPSKEFCKGAHLKSIGEYRRLYHESIKSPDNSGAPGEQGVGLVQAVEAGAAWKEPFAKWFVGGQLNVTVNCLDRWLRRHGQQSRADLGRRAGG